VALRLGSMLKNIENSGASMFGKNDQVEIKTLIAQGTRIEGDMKFEEGLRVDGEVHGAIHAPSEGSLLAISEGAVTTGGVVADPPGASPSDRRRS
jgi:cytoskeletal protein CcmA (bactofilin family)